MPNEPILTNAEIIRFIQIVVGMTLAVMGVYMIGPWYVIMPDAAAFGVLAEMSTLTSTIYIKVISGVQILSGVGVTYGALRGENVYTRTALIVAMSMYALIVATRLATVGLVPFVWMYQLALLLIIGAIALSAKKR